MKTKTKTIESIIKESKIDASKHFDLLHEKSDKYLDKLLKVIRIL